MNDAQILRELMVREEQLLNNTVRSDARQISQLMGDRCIAVSDSGKRSVYRVGDTLNAAEGVIYITSDSAQLSDLAPDCKLLSYISAQVINDKQSRSFNSSIWKKHDTDWKMVFHQGTTVPKDRHE